MSGPFGCCPECLYTMHRDNCTLTRIYRSRVTRNTVDLLEGGEQEKESCRSHKEFHDITVRLPFCNIDTHNNSRSVSLPPQFCVTIICVTLCSCERTFSHSYAAPFLMEWTGLFLPPSSSSSLVCIIHILSLARTLCNPLPHPHCNHINPEDGSSLFLQNVGNHLPHQTVQTAQCCKEKLFWLESQTMNKTCGKSKQKNIKWGLHCILSSSMSLHLTVPYLTNTCCHHVNILYSVQQLFAHCEWQLQ